MTINSVFTSLRLAYQDWAHFVGNPRFIRKGDCISWSNRKPIVLDDVIYPDQVMELADAGQFSFQIIQDGSLLQLYYQFEKDQLVSARLGYYSAGVAANMPVGWYRIDFSPQQHHGALHWRSHMHLSLFPDTRLVVDGVPTPRQFIEFVVSSCYPDCYGKYRCDDKGAFGDAKKLHSTINASPFELIEDMSAGVITHMRIPRI